MGAFRSLSGLSRAVGPSLIGGLFWICGPAVAFCIGAAATLYVSVMLKRIQFATASASSSTKATGAVTSTTATPSK